MIKLSEIGNFEKSNIIDLDLSAAGGHGGVNEGNSIYSVSHVYP